MRKRSKYRPRGVVVDTINWVKSGLQRLPDTDGDAALRLKNHMALAAAIRGEATKADVDILIAASNMAEAFIHMRENLGRDWAAEIRAGQNALLAMARRGLEKGRFVFTGPELQAFRLLMEVHDAQLDNITIKDMETALSIVGRIVASKKAITI